MKKLIFSFICLLLVAQSQARIITVDDNDLADFNSIQSAINDSNDGDIIEVAPEIYVQQFDEDIDLMGMDIIIRCKDSEDISILNSISSDPNVAQARLSSGLSYVPNELIIKFKKIIADRLEGEMLKGEQLGDLKLSSSLDMLNQRYKLRSIKALCKNFRQTQEQMEELLKKDKSLLTKREKHILTRLKRAKSGEKVPDLDRIYKLQVELEDGQSLEEVVVAYSNDPDVEYAELNYILSINLTPNDPLYSVQWPLNNTGQMYPESGRYNHPPGTPDCDIDAPEAWGSGTGSSEIIVAVVDTGVDYTHRDLQGNLWINEVELNGDEGVDDDGNGYIDDIYGYDFINNDSDPKDDHGHGTHCSGTVAAKGNNGLDITGVCWDARIMGLKLLSSSASGSTSDAVEAFYYAVNNGADVLSNSWGGEYYSQSMENAINYAYIQGVLVVASAGNKGTTSTQYPAFYDHVVAVAATNSNDEKAPFSTYGNWVEIAAPGVDVLSLRASGTSMGTVYNSYTTIASGTSMACPHVSGACALLLSLYPEGTVDEVTNTLKDSADPVEPRVCQSGRLNIDKAILKTVKSEGKIWMNKEVYSCSGIIEIFVADSDLKGAGTEDVGLSTDGNDFETLTLLENGTNTGIFCGDIGLSSDGVVVEDGTLQVGHGQMITATYDDVNDGTGNPATVEDSAMVDCLIPVVLDVNVMLSLTGRSATVRIEADEPTLAEVSCGFGCGGPYDIIRTDSIISTNHTIKLLPLTSGTDYYFVIGLMDTAGNEVVDNNEGQCYWFTPEFLGFLVPSVYPTIQSAINDANDGDEVVVADGTYTGDGNWDIDFLGKAITVRSESGPENCIIDCNRKWGFVFRHHEDANSVLDGFTVTNAKIGIDCDYASPTITNCIITGNTGYTGIDCRWRSKPTIDNCIISNNNWRQWGPMCAGITCDGSSPTITNCTISNNIAEYNGGGIYCIAQGPQESDPNIINCIISGNSAEIDGGGICHKDYGGSSKITNCTFIGNSAGHNGGGVYLECYPFYPRNTTIINCTFIGNVAEQDGGAIYLKDISSGRNDPTIVNCAFSGNSAGSNGGGIWNGSYKCTLTGCTLSGNSSELTGGGIFSDGDRPIYLTNCILWGNVDSGAPIHPCQIFGGTPEVLFSCIQDDDPNDTEIPFGDANGNIDDNPLFVRNPDDGGDGWGVGDNDDFGDLHLQKLSPCINAGLPNFIAGPNTVDIDGQPRIIGFRIDMGADEYEKMIVVTIPEGGEVWTAGSTHEIQWSSYDAGAVDILFSADSGGDWQTIESSAPDTESYIWHLPNRTDSNQCVISVVPGIPDTNVITVESGAFEIRRYHGPASLPHRPRPPGPRPGEQYGPEFGCVKWMFQTDGPVTSAVTVGRKIGQTTKAYIACEDGRLYALDVETGSLIWSYDINSPLLGSAAEGPQGMVYAGSTDGRLYAIDKEGRLLWTHTTAEPIYSTPVVSPQGRIYICSQDGTLYALARDGSELWCFETDGAGVTAGSIFATPATADDSTVYVGGLYDPNLYALNSDDGNIKWNCNFVRAVDIGDPFFGESQIIEKGGWPFASPVIAEDDTIYQGLVYDPNLYAIDPNDGSKIWSTSLAGLILRYGPSPEHYIIWYGAGEPPEYIEVDGIQRLVRDIYPYLYNSCWSRPALAPDGTIYVSFDDPYLRAVDPNGSIKWMKRLGEVGGFTLTVGSDGLIYAASDDANLYVIDPNGQIIAQFEGDDWLSHPIIAPDRTIIVSDANNTVWAISENACDGQEPVLDIPASKSEPNEQKAKDLPTETILSDTSKRRQNAGGNR